MFKMKSVLCIVAIFSLALVSCVERIPEKEMPNVDNGVITMIKATVEPLTLKGATGVGNYSWNETHTIGIYGTTVGENECYLPVKSTIGDNEAYFFGNSVGGNMTIYMPYVSAGSPAALDGRVTIPTQQNYYASPFDHLMYNSTFLAETKSDNVSFDYHAGLVKVELHYDIPNVAEVSVLVGNVTANGGYDDYCAGDLAVDKYAEELLVNGSNQVTVKGFPEGTNTTLAQPLTVWVALAPGTYENFVVEISNADMTISTPVKGPFVVEKCAIAENVCDAKEVKYDNGIGDFEGENGEFNPVN
jgi:hypothetical protein